MFKSRFWRPPPILALAKSFILFVAVLPFAGLPFAPVAAMIGAVVVGLAVVSLVLLVAAKAPSGGVLRDRLRLWSDTLVAYATGIGIRLRQLIDGTVGLNYTMALGTPGGCSSGARQRMNR